METLQITRRGCLAVHLMPEYHGKKLENAVVKPPTRHGDPATAKVAATKIIEQKEASR